MRPNAESEQRRTKNSMNTEPTSEAVRSSDLLGVDLIRAERVRQMEREWWGPEHDDTHTDGALAKAAACYALGANDVTAPRVVGITAVIHGERVWPWEAAWWKPSPQDRIRELVKAGALIAAEIDRLDRERRKTPNSPLNEPNAVQRPEGGAK